jgi:RNA polymerase sigma-70 factor (ECF subfamily)
VDPKEFSAVLEAARAGDEWAWSRLYGELAGPVLGYLRVKGATEPEDLLGEVFLQVARNLSLFSGDAAGFRSWIFTIAHRRMIDERRAAGRRPLELVVDRESGPSQDPALIVMDQLTEERIAATLECLVPDQRDVLLLRIMGGITVEEVAAILGKTIGAVKALQRRALQTIKRNVSEPVPI